MRQTVSGGAARAAAAVSIAALVLAACSSIDTPTGGGQSSSAENRSAKNGGTLVVALSDEPDPLDPTTARTLVGRSVFTSICEKLYDINAKLDIVPQLAADMPATSADGKTVTIKLRSGVKFADGTTMDAAAVKTSLDRDLTLPTSARKSDLNSVESVSVSDPSTVVLHLNAPFAPLVAQLADRAGMVMSPAALKSEGANFGAHPVCVGPFKFQSRVAQDHIDVVKDPNYYDASNVHLDKVSYKIIADSTTRFNNLRSGDVQVLDAVASTDVDALQADSNLQLLTSESLGYQGITVNLGNVNGVGKPAGTLPAKLGSAMATDPRVRQAFELSLDRAAINKVVFHGQFTPGVRADQPGQPVQQRRRPSLPQARPGRGQGPAAAGGRADAVQDQHDHRQHAGRRPARAGDPGPGQGGRLRPQAGADRVRRLADQTDAGELPDVPGRLVRPGRPGRQHLQLRHHGGSQNNNGYSSSDCGLAARRRAAPPTTGQRRRPVRPGDHPAAQGRCRSSTSTG